jgi:hypothetical protein
VTRVQVSKRSMRRTLRDTDKRRVRIETGLEANLTGSTSTSFLFGIVTNDWWSRA